MKFFEVLCLCHTVILDVSAKEQYQASSPDEFSFVKFCEQYVLIYLLPLIYILYLLTTN